MRQPSGANHQAQHQRDEITPGSAGRIAVTRAGLRVAGKRLGVRRQARQRTGQLGFGCLLAAPEFLGFGRRARQRGTLLLGGLDLGQRCVAGLQPRHPHRRLGLLGSQRCRNIRQAGRRRVSALLVDGPHLQLGRIADQFALAFGDLVQLLAVDQLGQRPAGLLDAEPDDRHQIGQDHDEVLGHLGPGDGPHAAEEGAHQHTAQADKHADLEAQAGQPRRDQAHAVDLRDQVDEGHQDGRPGAHQPQRAAVEAFTEEVAQRELPEAAQVGRDAQGHEAEAAGPAQHIGQARIAAGVQRAHQSDEAGGAHPVRPGGHAVVERRHAAAGHVVLARIGGAAQDADDGVHRHRRTQEGVADPGLRQPVALGHTEGDDHRDEAQREEGVAAVQAAVGHSADDRNKKPGLPCGEPGRAARACGLLARQALPGVDDGVRVQRDRHDALLGQPVGEVRMVAGALAADADVLAGGTAGADGARDQGLDGWVALVEVAGQLLQAGVAVQAECELRQVVGADRHAVEMLQELFGQDGVARHLAHHDQPQAVHASLEALLRQHAHHALGLLHGAHKGHHDLDVGQAHVLAHALQGLAFHRERVLELTADVARRATEAQHRVLFIRLVARAADQLAVLVGLEIRQPHDHRPREKGGGNRRDAFGQLVDVEGAR
mmetsp:Transcript_53285/g.125036  ORF Transcript_53285/g.125036 Transcript_53285/m.125036 type:complete len:660 (-) Transcript_53285:2122-4101(-)